jgi:chromosome segregation ATPase
MNNSENIKNKLDDLERLIIERFNTLEKKIDLLNNDNESIKKECHKMGSHIDFIEDTYNTLQMPLNYIKKSVERLTGSSSKDLPIKDKNSDDSQNL